jgi:hypothetical protein
MFPLLECGRHGQSPGYAVCAHIMNGAKAAYIIRATEKELGEEVTSASTSPRAYACGRMQFNLCGMFF